VEEGYAYKDASSCLEGHDKLHAWGVAMLANISWFHKKCLELHLILTHPHYVCTNVSDDKHAIDLGGDDFGGLVQKMLCLCHRQIDQLWSCYQPCPEHN
jgi:hypothetical protein